MSAATVAPVGMYVSPLIASAERWIGSRQRFEPTRPLAWIEPGAVVGNVELDAFVAALE